MCSVSFLPNDDGFWLAMNRDEQRSRMSALPPEVNELDGLRALFPREWSGGTWIGLNDAGMIFALINWYSQPQLRGVRVVSRGEVIRALLGSRNQVESASRLAALPLGRMNPFRLIAIDLASHSLTEWRSNSRTLDCQPLAWRRRHWFSSGHDEAKATRVRRGVCEMHAIDSPAALRALHASHSPAEGPFSVCMHRPDACTVSYTEITMAGGAAAMRYFAGPLCSRPPRFSRTLRVRPQQVTLAAAA